MVDSIAVYVYPSDGPANHFPVCVQGDGNCQFKAVSLLLTDCPSVRLSVCLPVCLSICQFYLLKHKLYVTFLTLNA